MKNLYFIDDDDAAHTYHRLMAEEAGYTTDHLVSFYNVDSAINHLKDMISTNDFNKWPDYVFIDLNMPIKSGFDFVNEIEAILPLDKLPNIFLVSSSKNPIDVERASSHSSIKGFETKFLELDFFMNLISENTN